MRPFISSPIWGLVCSPTHTLDVHSSTATSSLSMRFVSIEVRQLGVLQHQIVLIYWPRKVRSSTPALNIPNPQRPLILDPTMSIRPFWPCMHIRERQSPSSIVNSDPQRPFACPQPAIF